MGLPMNENATSSTYYRKFVDKGGRIIAVRVPAEMNKDMEARARSRGMTYSGYLMNALYWYMRHEDEGITGELADD